MDPDNEFLRFLNPDSLTVHTNCMAEPAVLAGAAEPAGGWFQFEREGYYYADLPATASVRAPALLLLRHPPHRTCGLPCCINVSPHLRVLGFRVLGF